MPPVSVEGRLRNFKRHNRGQSELRAVSNIGGTNSERISNRGSDCGASLGMQTQRKSSKTNCTLSGRSSKSNISINNRILSAQLQKRLWMIKQLSASVGEAPVVKVCSSSINECFICSLCNGYLYKATTITECLHTFCKSCIVKHLTFNLNCPKCNIEIHPTDPFVNIRSDSTIQDLLYKLLPNVEKEEKAREQLFLERLKNGEFPNIKVKPNEKVEAEQNHKKKSYKETKIDQNQIHIGFEINLLGCCTDDIPINPPLKAYFSMPLSSTIRDAQKFIEKQLEIPPETQVNFFVCGYLISPLLGVDKLWDILSDGDALESFLSLSYAIMPSKDYFEGAKDHGSK